MGKIFQFIVLTTLLFGYSTGLYAQVNIIVNKHKFSTVEEAAYGEDEVDFFDANHGDENAITECYAALELKKFLSKISSDLKKDINFSFPHKKLPSSGDLFIIGCKESNDVLNRYSQFKTVEFNSEQSFAIYSFIENNRTVTLIQGASRIGTLYGVYAYLEKLGFRFIGLGETGMIIPGDVKSLPKDKLFIENPSFLSRGYWAWGDRKSDMEFFEWMARNKMNFWTAENQPVETLKKLGIKLTDGGHAIQGLFINPKNEYPYNHKSFFGDDKKAEDPYLVSNEYLGDKDGNGKLSYYEAHPEWYSLQSGRRSAKIRDKGGDNFCVSNADARKELAINMVNSLIGGDWKFVDIVNFWMLDYGRWCSCENCQKAGTETDKVFLIVHDILEQLKKEKEKLNRKVEISAIAYVKTLVPPSKPLPENFDYENSSVTFFPIRRCFAHPIADPSCSELNQSQIKAFESWVTGENRNYKGSMFIGEYYNISKFKSLPVVLSKIISTDVPWYYDKGARHFHYMHVPTKLWGTWSLNQYLLSKVLWQADINTDKVLDEYFTLFYPGTYETTRKMYAQLEIASANLKILKHDVGTPWHFNLANNFLNGDMFQLKHFKYDERNKLSNSAPSMVEIMKAATMSKIYMEQALIACTDSLECQRLLEDKLRVDYGYNMYMYLYHIVRTAMFHQRKDSVMAKQEFAQLQNYAENLKNVTDIVNVASKDANSKNGFEAAHSQKQFARFKALYGDSAE